MKRFLAGLAFALLFPALTWADPLTPQITAKEQATYAKMLETNAAQAKEYLSVRNYLSLSRQVIANPSRAIDLPVQPLSLLQPRWTRHLTIDEQMIVDKAVDMNIFALVKKNR